MSLLLNAVPKHIVADILKKVDLVTLTRMRKTTTGVHTIAEETTCSLKNKNHSVDSLRIEIGYGNNGELKLTTTVFFNEKRTVLTDPVAQLSGAYVRSLMIMCSDGLLLKKAANEEMNILSEVVELLKKLRLSPKVLHLPGLCIQFAKGVLASLMGIEETILLTYPPVDFEYMEFSQHPAVKRCKHVIVTKFGTTSYEECKDFDCIRMTHLSLDDVKDFIKTVHADPIIHRLRRTHFSLLYRQFGWRNVLGNFLEDGSLREMQRFTHNVYIMESGTKWIALQDKDNGSIYLVICEKTPEALWKTLVDCIFERNGIKIDVSKYQKEFYEAKNLEEQAKIFDRMLDDNSCHTE